MQIILYSLLFFEPGLVYGIRVLLIIRRCVFEMSVLSLFSFIKFILKCFIWTLSLLLCVWEEIFQVLQQFKKIYISPCDSISMSVFCTWVDDQFVLYNLKSWDSCFYMMVHFMFLDLLGELWRDPLGLIDLIMGFFVISDLLLVVITLIRSLTKCLSYHQNVYKILLC